MKYSFPQTMTAVKIDGVTGKLITRIVPVPKPGKGEVLIKIAAAPINPSDIARIKSTIENEESLSFVPGIEGSGRVVAAGNGLIPSLFMGKRVACSAAYPVSGTYAEYMLTNAALCFPIPKEISDEQASMFLVNPMTALAFFDIIKQKRHKAVISTAAAGALGRIIEFLGNKYGIPVINIVRREEQLSDLKAQGSKFVLNSSHENFPDQLKELASGLNATLVLDAIGGEGTGNLIEAIPYGGSLIVYGSLSGEQPELNYRVLVSDNKNISGFYLANWSKDNGLMKTIRNIFRVRQLLKSEIKINVRARFPLNRAQEALDSYLENMTAGKVILIPDLS